ncbi:hypothetical protein QBC40DRAFT_258560 [Triangularia verruculosa]|uniref:Uncharacterized protein n=1 Tax=Triangularia verruculosa TaxID=2587418 RepID=A0AAN7AP19_9PEZI|nr:hypothetical protein QBC40DRAFT_258560 [Triangularia verruculosa]
MSKPLEWTIPISPGVTNTLPIPALGVAVLPSTIRIIAAPSPRPPQSSETEAKSQRDTLGTIDGPSDTKSSGWRGPNPQIPSDVSLGPVRAHSISALTNNSTEMQTSRADRHRSRSSTRDRHQQWRDRSPIHHGSAGTRLSGTESSSQSRPRSRSVRTSSTDSDRARHSQLADLDEKIAKLELVLREEKNCMRNLEREAGIVPARRPLKELEQKKEMSRSRRRPLEDKLQDLAKKRSQLLSQINRQEGESVRRNNREATSPRLTSQRREELKDTFSSSRTRDLAMSQDADRQKWSRNYEDELLANLPY